MQAAVAPLNRGRASQPAEKLSPVVGLSSCLPSSGWSGWSGWSGSGWSGVVGSLFLSY